MSVWGGYSGAWQHVRMKLPGMAGSKVQLRWEYTQDSFGIGTDLHSGSGVAGVAVDNIIIKSVVLGATPVLTWNDPMPIIHGTALSSNQLNATASVPGSFSYSPTNGAVLDISTNLLSVLFTPDDTTNYVSVSGNVSLIVLPPLIYDGVDLTDPAQALADLDGDGISNLMEYALGTDQRDPADAQRGMGISILDDSGAKYLSVSFKRRRDLIPLPLEYLPEVSADQQTWFSDPGHVLLLQVMPLDAQFDWVTARDSTSITPNTPRFIRPRVMEP